MFGIQRYQLRKPVLIIGFMAAGKTSIAKHLNQMTGSKYYDLDKEIVFLTKKTITEIFNNGGVDKFREFEQDILKRHCDEIAFIATGGGCVDNPKNRGILKDHFCIYLKADFETLKDRIEDSSAYPMYESDNQAKELLQKREPLYRRFSNLTIDVNNKDVSEISEEIRKKLLDKQVLLY